MMGSGDVVQRGLPTGVLDSDPDAHEASRRTRLDIAMPGVHLAGPALDRAGTPKNDVVAEKRPQQRYERRMRRELIPEAIGDGAGLLPVGGSRTIFAPQALDNDLALRLCEKPNRSEDTIPQKGRFRPLRRSAPRVGNRNR